MHWSETHCWGKNRRNEPFRRKTKKPPKPPNKPKENCIAISRAAEIYQFYQTPETKKGDQVHWSSWLNREIYLKYSAYNSELRMLEVPVFSSPKVYGGRSSLLTEKCWRAVQLKLEFIICECMISMQSWRYVMIYSSHVIQDHLDQVTATLRTRTKVLVLCSHVHVGLLSGRN